MVQTLKVAEESSHCIKFWHTVGSLIAVKFPVCCLRKTLTVIP